MTRQIQLAPAAFAPRRGSEYAELSRQVKQAGLLERRSAYYAWKIAVTIGMLAAGWTAFVVVGDSWWQLAVAAFLAVVFTQIGFLGHDAGHRQVFSTRRASYVAGILLGNLGIGLSYGWWVGKHNRHHAHPNQDDADPDIAAGALAFTSAQARAGRGAARLVFRYQAYLFFPMLLLEAVSLHVASVRALTRRAARRRSWERALIIIHAAGYLTVVFLRARASVVVILPCPDSAVARFAIMCRWWAGLPPSRRPLAGAGIAAFSSVLFLNGRVRGGSRCRQYGSVSTARSRRSSRRRRPRSCPPRSPGRTRARSP